MTAGSDKPALSILKSSTVVKAVTETPFFNTDAMGNYTLQQGWETHGRPIAAGLAARLSMKAA